MAKCNQCNQCNQLTSLPFKGLKGQRQEIKNFSFAHLCAEMTSSSYRWQEAPEWPPNQLAFSCWLMSTTAVTRWLKPLPLQPRCRWIQSFVAVAAATTVILDATGLNALLMMNPACNMPNGRIDLRTNSPQARPVGDRRTLSSAAYVLLAGGVRSFYNFGPIHFH